jgi:hypothetical protein
MGYLFAQGNPEMSFEPKRKRGFSNRISILVGLIGLVASIIQIYDFLVNHPQMSSALSSGLSRLYQDVAMLFLFAFIFSVPYLEARNPRSAQVTALVGVLVGIVLSFASCYVSPFEALLGVLIGLSPYSVNMFWQNSLDPIDDSPEKRGYLFQFHADVVQ